MGYNSYVKIIAVNSESHVSKSIRSRTLIDSIELVAVPPIYNDSKFEKRNNKSKHKNVAILNIDKALITGDSNLVLIDKKYAIFDLLNQEIEHKILYTDNWIAKREKNILHIKKYGKPIRIKKGIKLTGNFSWNYYHFMYEILPYFNYLDHVDKDVPIILDKIVDDTPQFKEAVNRLNHSNREIVYIEKNQTYVVDELVYITPIHEIAPDYNIPYSISFDDNYFCSKNLEIVRGKFVSTHTNVLKKKIYLSREHASGRRKFNEDEVFNVLEKYGFEKVYPERLSIQKQAELFSSASHIVGGSGAALTNILFCEKETKVYCLANFRFNISIFSTIAHLLGVELIYVYDKNTVDIPQTNLHIDFKIDCNELIEMLNEEFKWERVQ